MTASTSMSVFHQWLLADPTSNTSACAIILHIADSRPADLLIQEITDYLNEYDDDGEGRWLPATPELVEKVARDPSHRRLLGLSDNLAGDPEDGAPVLLKTLRALGRRGHVVFRTAGVTDEALGTANAFHAGVGTAGEITSECHLILNPDLISQSCIAHVIGDVFLEWLLCETRRNAPIQDIR
jgi:hypothetical protein